MKRIHCAILAGEILTYVFIITFIFADMTFNFTSVLRFDAQSLTPPLAAAVACLVALMGTINVWLSWYYMHKSNKMRDWLLICAWTHRIKQGDRWLSLEEFLHGQLGFEVSHGLSDPNLVEMRDQLDAEWRQFLPESQKEAS